MNLTILGSMVEIGDGIPSHIDRQACVNWPRRAFTSASI